MIQCESNQLYLGEETAEVGAVHKVGVQPLLVLLVVAVPEVFAGVLKPLNVPVGSITGFAYYS